MMQSGKVPRLAAGYRDGYQNAAGPAQAAIGALFALIGLLSVIPCAALDSAVLIRELHFPAISLDLDVSFPIRDLRIPPSKDPQADIEALNKRLETEDSPEMHLELARLLLWTGQYELAVVHYRVATDGYMKLLEKDPKNAKAHHQLAEVLIALGEDEDAAAHIEEAFVYDDKLWQAHELASYLHAKNGVHAHDAGLRWLMESHFAAAESEGLRAVELAPTEPLAHVALFLSKWLPLLIALRDDPLSGLKRIAEFEEVSELLLRAANLAPHYPRLRQHAVSCKLAPFFAAQMVKGISDPIWPTLDETQKRLLTSCRDEYMQLVQAAPELKARVLLFAGIAEFMMDNRKAMYQRFREAADADPQDSASLQTMVGFLVHEKKWPEALQAAEELMQRSPSGEAYTWLGRIYGEQEKWKQAEEAFRVALSYEDVRGIANLGLGIVLLKSGADPSAAVPVLRAAAEELPGEPEVALAWGVAQALTGQEEKGAQCVARALALLPPSPGRQALAEQFGLKIDARQP